ncbi:pilus assembly protein N-terminal domain-containing protein [Anaerovibrio lipolyticus]|uniref:type II and III secretion system protein family protein n=1 Tax=Anaerovibrio lipolyticus TaxID=82374 RepID=UPI0025F56595|nr:pilus assembly protein N-terminal domain-containing protein [Anaerovibrio lipolyticus]
MKKTHNWQLHITTMLTAFMLFLSTSVAAAYVQPLYLEINQATLFNASSYADIIRVAIANPAIADVNVINNRTLNIIGVSPGTTSLTVWTDNGMQQDFIVNVSNKDSGTSNAIKKAINIPGVQVEKVGDKILLKGKVRNQYEKQQANNVAVMYVSNPENVINMLEMDNPTQINLAAMVIDISNADAKELGIMTGSSGTVETEAGDFSGISFGSFYGGQDFKQFGPHVYNNINFKLNLLIKQGKARILSRPNVTTMSGEEAEILIGGEIPLPTSNKNGDISITWREYGIKLHIKPTATPDNNITTGVNAEISSLDNSNAVTTNAGTIPALLSRKASTVITIPDGETMSIGGLMNNSESKNVNKIPLLSSIPIIGEFFKYTSTSRDRHELVILITPTIVNSDDPLKVSQPFANAVDQAKQEYATMKEVSPNDLDIIKNNYEEK